MSRKNSKTKIARKNTKRNRQQPGVLEKLERSILEHFKILLWPGLLWFIFVASVFLVPYLSIVFTKQLAFLFVVLFFFIIIPLVVIIKKKVIFYSWRFSSLVLSFLFYGSIVAWINGIFEYNFWDLSLFVDIHPYTLILGALGLMALVFTLVQFKDAPKNFFTALPCVVVVWDLLGFVVKSFAPFIEKILGIVSVNLGKMYGMYFKRYGLLSLYPDSNFWLLVHLLSLLIIIPLLVRDYNRNNKLHFMVRFIITLLLSWFLTYPVGSITFAFLWGIVLFVIGIIIVVKNEFGLRQGFVSGILTLLIVVILMFLQYLIGIKGIHIDSNFWGSADLVATYKTYDKAIRAHEILPGIFKGSLLQNLLLGLSFGKLGPLMGLLNFVVPKAVYNGFVVLLIETGLLGAIFWFALLVLLLQKKKDKKVFSQKISRIAIILVMLWQALTGVSLWSLLLLFLLVFLLDALNSNKLQEVKLDTDKPLAYLLRFNFYTFAVLGTIIWILSFSKIFSIVKGMYGIKLREVEASTLNGAERFKKLEKAFYYVQQTRINCRNCKLLDISGLQILTQLDDMLYKEKDLVKTLNIDTLYVEQLHYYMITGAYKLMGDMIIPEANTITAYVLDKLGIRQNSKLLQSLAIIKYDQAINVTPTNYNLAYNYAKLLLLQESKKDDSVYNRLVSLFKLLAGLSSNSPSRTVEVALLQGQFYIKYKEYDKAKELYTKVKEWVSKQTFKKEEDKKAWLSAIEELLKKVDSYQQVEKESVNNNSK